MQKVLALAAISSSTVLAATAGFIVLALLFASPALVSAFEARLLRWPAIARLFNSGRILILAMRASPLKLAAVFVLAVTPQILSAFAMLVLAHAMETGTLNVSDWMLAAPLTLAVNTLPLTPNGIGVGEVAFDRICHWLELTPSNAAYSTFS